MKVIIREFSNGNIAASMDAITVSHAGATVVNEKTIEVIDVIARDYFKNPQRYVVDFTKGEVHAKPDAA